MSVAADMLSRSKSSSTRSMGLIGTLAVVVVVVALWQLTVITNYLDFDSIPTPRMTAEAFGTLVAGAIWGPLGHTLYILVISFIFASLIGILLGMAVGLSETINSYTKPALEFMRFVPPPAIIPVVLLITGFTDTSEIIIATFASLWPVFLNTIDGARALTPELSDVGEALEMSWIQRLRFLVIPSALPLIAVGLRLALSLCIIIVVTTEIVAIQAGVGYELIAASSSLKPGQVYAITLIVGLLGLILNDGFRRGEERLLANRRSR